jgi:hypothetical protein
MQTQQPEPASCPVQPWLPGTLVHEPEGMSRQAHLSVLVQGDAIRVHRPGGPEQALLFAAPL